ncbi:TetR/AcrR family transcriptional regulator [Corynebacterium ammoniagenes]|nr:TetR/AcrR family transcriptional regulator [Corynebacterium ammoniagenes]APT82084.1 transcriptional regulator [Corynebacterium ammoniagenes DSM 20306]AQS73191.1 transcriptional regulator [Corynebacterium ammoniagenes]
MPTKKPLTPRQRELFNALLNDFLSEGFESFTIDNASKRYRCSKSTIYGLGTTRDEILARILVSYFKEISRRTTPEITSRTSFEKAFIDYFDNIKEALSAASPKFMQDLASDPVARDIYGINTKAAIEIIHSLLERGVASGEFQITSISFTSRLIQQAMDDIQQGTYLDVLETKEAYASLGQLILTGLKKP